jgi:hypothetical protein
VTSAASSSSSGAGGSGGLPSIEICNGLDDEGNGVIDDPPACTRRVFVTSQLYQGNLGGLAGADAKCQGLADGAGLGGTYKAWLSDSTVSAADRLTHVGAPYVLADGLTVVANDWTNLVSANEGYFLQHAIDRTETMAFTPIGSACATLAPVWTSTQPDGTLEEADHTCEDWTSSEVRDGFTCGNALGGPGAYGSWSSICGAGWGCHFTAALYCFEQ